MRDTRAAFVWVIRLLRKKKIHFYITGGFAARAYGSTRRLRDIDLDIKEKDFSKILPSIKKYIVFGPTTLINAKWKTPLITIKFKGQEIDFCGADNCWINYNKKWKNCPMCKKTIKLEIFGQQVEVINPQELIDYKKLLSGEHQKRDIFAINQFIKKQNTLVQCSK
jgi:hypothetical protein